ncbi:unnamed protein product [Gadus morhua 'NCC']
MVVRASYGRRVSCSELADSDGALHATLAEGDLVSGSDQRLNDRLSVSVPARDWPRGPAEADRARGQGDPH